MGTGWASGSLYGGEGRGSILSTELSCVPEGDPALSGAPRATCRQCMDGPWHSQPGVSATASCSTSSTRGAACRAAEGKKGAELDLGGLGGEHPRGDAVPSPGHRLVVMLSVLETPRVRTEEPPWRCGCVGGGVFVGCSSPCFVGVFFLDLQQHF